MNTGDPRRILDHPGPFATVHLDGSHDTESADQELALRWRAARDDLAGQDVAAETLDALEDALLGGEPTVGRAGRLLVGAAGEVLLDRTLPDPPPTPVTRAGPLPYLMPLVERDTGQVPYVAALVNKVGADVRVVDADGVVRTEETTEGRDHPVHKVRGGGWAHLRMQRHVEEIVHQNVKLVADELARLVDDVHARLLVVGGEEQVVALLERELPPRCAQILATPPGRREAPEEFEQAVVALAAERAGAEHDEVLDQFREQLAADRGLAVQGLIDATAALREHNAEALVIGDVGDTTLWYGENPRSVARTEEELRALGVEHAVEARADEVLPDFAFRIDADVVSANEQLMDGVGVLRRHR
jgi:hypothetical protein